MRPNYPLLEGERRPVSERGLILAWIGDGRSEKGNWRGVELEVGRVRNSAEKALLGCVVPSHRFRFYTVNSLLNRAKGSCIYVTQLSGHLPNPEKVKGDTKQRRRRRPLRRPNGQTNGLMFF